MIAMLLAGVCNAQNCPNNTPATINSNPDTYYPGLDANLNPGTTLITLGAAGSGTTPIASGDLLLLIQMQGAQINSTNSNSYGDGISGGASNGYLSNSALTAGNMEYVIAAGSVPLAGGVLPLQTATTKNYKNAAFSSDGQYRYQVIRVAIYYNLTLGSNITAAAWNGSTGGVLVISVTNTLNFNGRTVSAAGAGFRGGAARQLNGGPGGAYTDLVTLSSKPYNASKGEGIAGTPRYVNNNGSLLDNGAANEGYPNGSYAAGAPGNAGGGGTDGNTATNDQNAGGGGGANGGAGGRGGNSWSSNLPSGGEPGAIFQQRSASRLVMGGGGGSGTTNNGTGFSLFGFSSSGAAGGGIVLLTANTITGTGTIDVSGAGGNLTVLNDGSGGGGAGGSVLLYAGSGLAGITVNATGGVGGTNTGTGSPHGPGGGGGGGAIFSNGILNTASSAAAGEAGYTAGTNHYNAAAGNTGILVQNTPRDQIPPQFLYCSLLPVHFVSVSATWQQKNVVINWQVSNEMAVKNYAVERSTDGRNFSAIAVVPYKNTASETNQYRYTDIKPVDGIAYYRISEQSENGAIVYSSVIIIKVLQGNEEMLSVYPNPVVNAPASIRFVNKLPNNNMLLRMIAAGGNTVWQKQYRAAAGVNIITLDNLQGIPNGSYFLQYNNGVETAMVKVAITH